MAWFNGEWYDDGSSFVTVHDWCPQCQPEALEPYTLRLCGIHTPDINGSADKQAQGISGSFWVSGSADVEGLSNAKWCRLIHQPSE